MRVNCAAKNPLSSRSPKMPVIITIGLKRSEIFPRKKNGVATTIVTTGVTTNVRSPNKIAAGNFFFWDCVSGMLRFGKLWSIVNLMKKFLSPSLINPFRFPQKSSFKSGSSGGFATASQHKKKRGNCSHFLFHMSRFLKKACPEPDFRYFSKLYAIYLSWKAKYATKIIGSRFIVAITCPFWCLIMRFLRSDVQPI